MKQKRKGKDMMLGNLIYLHGMSVKDFSVNWLAVSSRFVVVVVLNEFPSRFLFFF